MKHDRQFSKLRNYVLLALLLVSLTGCYESDNVTLYEPGVYKGDQDPLVKKLRDDKFQAELEQRFKTGQMDR